MITRSKAGLSFKPRQSTRKRTDSRKLKERKEQEQEARAEKAAKVAAKEARAAAKAALCLTKTPNDNDRKDNKRRAESKSTQPSKRPANVHSITVDKENKENRGVTSHQSTPKRGPICIFGQKIFPVGSAYKPSEWRILGEKVNDEFDRLLAKFPSPLGGGVSTPGAYNTQEFDLGFDFDTPHRGLYVGNSSQSGCHVRAPKSPLSPFKVKF